MVMIALSMPFTAPRPTAHSTESRFPQHGPPGSAANAARAARDSPRTTRRYDSSISACTSPGSMLPSSVSVIQCCFCLIKEFL